MLAGGRKYGETSTTDHSHWAALLRECKSLPQAKKLHAEIIDHGLSSSTYLANLLIQLYGRCGSVADASSVFSSMAGNRNIFSWNIMFTVFAQQGDLGRARDLFDRMPDRNVVSWNAMLACYAQSSQIAQAELLFRKMPQRSLASWNSMIAAYAQNDLPEEALEIFTRMDLEGISPDKITFVSAVNACSSMKSLYHGKIARMKIHESGLESDVSVGNVLITMYGRCGSIQDARDCFDKIKDPSVVSWTALLTAYAQRGDLQEAAMVFDRMPVKNEVSWTAMITAHTQFGHAQQAILLFRRMDLDGVYPDEVTVVSAIDACAHQGDLAMGIAVHSDLASSGGIEIEDAAVGNSLINLYGKCRMAEEALEVFQSMRCRKNVVSWTAIVAALAQNKRLDQARDLFNRMPIRNVVSWNAIITGYLDDDRPPDAIDLYYRMRQEGVPADRVTFVAMLEAAASITNLVLGRVIHSHTQEEGIDGDILVGTALLSMYGRCGCTEMAIRTFHGMPPRHDVVVWSALIASFSHCGNGGKALEVFHGMLLDGILPNGVTLVSVLSACSHIGAVEKGWGFLASMSSDFGIQPSEDHLACAVDLLGRSGRLAEAEEFLLDKDEEGGGRGWKSLLGSCQGDVGRASRIAELVLRLDPVDCSSHVTISNILASASPALGFNPGGGKNVAIF
ncbi:pentatricopeptide repeat-containing protein At2g13600 [Selaginella moellendorffii]|nr:pentatricopeptide repeat-containing protein At2g13600 [Selaginella moellendorffii]|eukprot:XP_002989881.2 pentatricopeptide repeat-containing protein At2g13600 [Selaginella moellendorffii]